MLKPGPDLGKAIKYLKELIEANPDLNNKQDLLKIFKNEIPNRK